jgi:hypothetical protein
MHMSKPQKLFDPESPAELLLGALFSFGWRALTVGGLVQRARGDPGGVADVSGFG